MFFLYTWNLAYAIIHFNVKTGLKLQKAVL